jgi:hypothetical protein
VTPVSRGSDRISATFDDPNAVVDAGLLLVATLSGRLGLEALMDGAIRLGTRVGAASPGRKILSLVHAMTAGAACIDDINRLRAGATDAVLDHRLMAPSTVGTFLRAFSMGQVRQLDKAAGEALSRAWGLGAAPTATLVIDIDSTVKQTHGATKIGARYSYTRVVGYHPLLATRADTGEVLGVRLRNGAAGSSKGAVSFVREVLGRVQRAEFEGPILVRADSSFYQDRLLDDLAAKGVFYSVTIPQRAPVSAAISAIDEASWQPIAYPHGQAHVAETRYQDRRLIVRRVIHDSEITQDQLFVTWHYHAFVTNRSGDIRDLDVEHRHHAVIELTIRDLKAGPLAHLPSASFAANAAWLVCAALAHNLLRWTAHLGGTITRPGELIVAKTFTTKFLHIPGRLVRPARRHRLRLPRHWPWAAQWLHALNKLRTLPALA